MAAIDAVLRERARLDGGATYQGWPVSWWQRRLYRCQNDHVRYGFQTNGLGQMLCRSCQSHVHLTFPGDKTGTLVGDAC